MNHRFPRLFSFTFLAQHAHLCIESSIRYIFICCVFTFVFTAKFFTAMDGLFYRMHEFRKISFFFCFLAQTAATEAHCHFCLALFASYEWYVYLHARGCIEFACKRTGRLFLAITQCVASAPAGTLLLHF